jgi:hypothetical protein
MRLLGSASKPHLCDQRRRSKVTGLSDLMTLFIDLGCLYCKLTQRAFNVFKNMLNWLKIDSVDQKFNWLECGNFSQDAGMPGTERVIAFSQLAVKGLINNLLNIMNMNIWSLINTFIKNQVHSSSLTFKAEVSRLKSVFHTLWPYSLNVMNIWSLINTCGPVIPKTVYVYGSTPVWSSDLQCQPTLASGYIN